MIEIILDRVEMPPLEQQRYQREWGAFPKMNGKVIDTENNNVVVYKGSYEDVCIAAHNLNKKYYLIKNKEK